MKKLITILAIMMVLVGFAFAANDDELKVTAKVAEQVPGFKIFGGLAANTITTEGTQEGATIATNKDIALDSITVYFKLTQYSITNTYNKPKAKYKGTATLTVTATPLSATVNEVVYSSDNPTCANATAKTIPGITFNPAASNGSNSVVFTLVYDGRTIDDQDVATFDFTWPAKDSLPKADTYTATVTLNYETT